MTDDFTDDKSSLKLAILLLAAAWALAAGVLPLA